MIIKEFCAENLTDLPKLVGTDITRIELCDNLAQGGTTPSYGVIKEACHYLHDNNITVATMIRPRGGDFVYNDTEIRVMEDDILKAVELESDALVFGMLTEDNEIDIDGIEQLLPACQGVDMVFHMAFDLIPEDKQKEAIDTLINLGFVRILLHGSKERRDIFKNVDHLLDLIAYANNRIEILLGGGVSDKNYKQLLSLTKTNQVHGTGLLVKS
ncbi:copper homeostasis protein CutC [Streptococcus zalophi]|uniref:PF03932 family protein CutC n=1 Tax=Streptococcus zalophi TaxID=640031 RepID=A0A934UDD9_9STRE|nr:copper homeostasis protein CutC [Streptococcus zalophi]MBJ8349697.1 copper homeostasis protein CutC [Streptococcus zalophi]